MFLKTGTGTFQRTGTRWVLGFLCEWGPNDRGLVPRHQLYFPGVKEMCTNTLVATLNVAMERKYSISNWIMHEKNCF